MKIAEGIAISPGRALECADVGAGDEGLPCAHEHDGGHRRIGLRFLDRFGDRRGHTGTEGIHRRIVDGDDGDAVTDSRGH